MISPLLKPAHQYRSTNFASSTNPWANFGIYFGSNGQILICQPQYTQGDITYLDCRNAGGIPSDIPPPPLPTCQHDRTETTCLLVSLLCRDICRYPSGLEKAGDWYYCGVCFGSP